MLGRLDWNRDTAAQLEAVSEVWRVLERSMNSSLGSKSDMVECPAKSGKREVSYRSLGVTTHISLATLVEKEYWGLLQSSTEVPEGANTMVEAAS